MHIFFSVGEPSGDLHAARLISELRRQRPGIQMTAFGGHLMEQAGCRLLYRLTDLAVMGFIRVVPLLWTFFRLVRKARQHLRDTRPDAVILVDFPGFNWWIARAARNLKIPVIYYVPPQLWAWAPWRVGRMRRFVDHVLCCLPFEEAWYRARGVSAEFVGHPFFDEVAERGLDGRFMAQAAERKKARRLVAILPGSRNHEVAHNFPLQIAVMQNLAARLPDARFLVACYKDAHKRQCAAEIAARAPNLPVELHVGRTSEIIESAAVCLMVSGSVSLELLARTTPAVVVYRVGFIFYWFARAVAICKYISLPNLIADRLIMPEFAPYGDCSGTILEMTALLHHWLIDPAEHARRVAELAGLKSRVATAGATANAAAAILARLNPSATSGANRVAA